MISTKNMTKIIDFKLFYNSEDKKHYYETTAIHLGSRGIRGPFDGIFSAVEDAKQQLGITVVALKYNPIP